MYIFLARHSHILPSQDLSPGTFRTSLGTENEPRNFYTVLLDDIHDHSKGDHFPNNKIAFNFSSLSLSPFLYDSIVM